MRRANTEDGDPARHLRSITRKVSNDDNYSQRTRTPPGKIPTKYKSSSQLYDKSLRSNGVAHRADTPQQRYATPERRSTTSRPSYSSLSRIPPPASNPSSEDSQLESLESLLARAGYKETRVFTPEAEKVKAFARRVIRNWDDDLIRGVSGSGLRHGTAVREEEERDEMESPLKRWGNASHIDRSAYAYVEPSLPLDAPSSSIPLPQDVGPSSQAASSSLRNILASDAHRSRTAGATPIGRYTTSPEPHQADKSQQNHAYDVFDQIIHARVERIARTATAASSDTGGGTTNSSEGGRKRRVLNRVELDFAAQEEGEGSAQETSAASSLASVTISDPSFGNDMPSPEYQHRPNAGDELRTVSIDDLDEDEFEEVARVEYQLGRHVFPPPKTMVRDDQQERFDPAAYEAEETDGGSVEYADQVGYTDGFGDVRRRYSSDGYTSQADDSRSTISETEYGVIQTASIVRRSGSPTPPPGTTTPTNIPARPAPVKRRTIIPGSPPHLSTALDTGIQPTTITTRVGDQPVQRRMSVSLGDGMTARKLRHAISTPAFGKPSSSAAPPPLLPTLPFRAPSVQPEGWLSKVGRVWSGSSVVSNTSKASIEENVPAPPRVPKPLCVKAPARPASPRVHRTGPVVCNTQDGEDLPPVSAGMGKTMAPSQDQPRRGLRTMFSLQNLRSAVVPHVSASAMSSPIHEDGEEDPLTPTLSPRLNWDARDLWDPQPLGGFNALYQPSGADASVRTIYPEPDFTKSFFYSPATPPTGTSKSAPKKANAAKQAPLQPKRQQSIKSLRAALEKDTARLRAEADVPPVPALPKHLAALATPQKSTPMPPVIAISSPNSCEAGLPPRALSLEGEEWEGGSFESRNARERRVRKGSLKKRKSGLRHSKITA
ncbi:hypothetical protein NliqN6_3963 [Naganishia liquefaciens]|uniref:Uncharacterized protein n=1 Tax=Naganishia liquefaciens TaxID=104408 RepID=A0A8H3TV78_9TREE|nr:hypothetical protein NliqN6_3963 [Naganishia liquefaciens]